MPAAARAGQRPRRIAVIYNPVAGWRRSRRLARVVAALERRGLEVAVMETARRGDAEAFAHGLEPGAFDIVAAAGGDGTANEVANGLVGRGMALAVIPLGTANVLAAEIGMPSDAEGIARAIAEGRPHPVYLGFVGERRFLQMAGIGFDAHIVAAVTPPIKRLLGKAAYVLWSLLGLARFPFRTYAVTVDGRRFDVASAVLAKGHFYAGRYVCAPDARLEDPSIEMCLFLRSGRLAVLNYGLALLLGRLPMRTDVKIVRARRIAISDGSGEPVQADGDILAHLPLEAGVDGTTIPLIFPT